MKRAIEPTRRSLLDVIKKNLHALGRKTYITRVTYIGEYTGSREAIAKKMENVIQRLGKDLTSVKITGLLLVYPQYYVHVLETSEDVIYKHFVQLHEDESVDCEMKKAILLPSYHHVNQTFFDQWHHMYTVPPALIQKLESHKLADIQHHLNTCFTKMYTLCDSISGIMREHSLSVENAVKLISDALTRRYPESTLIEYLLTAEHPVLMTVEEYLRIHSTVPYIKLYSDTIWPPPRDLIFSDGMEASDRPSIIKRKES